jgi:hypothetical protein
MIIKQLSVFLENKSGRLTEVTEILASANINLSAFCVADSADYGILRFITNKPEEAASVLKAKGLSVHLTDVIGLIVPHEPGSLHKALKLLSSEGISVEYMYAFSLGNRAAVIIRTDSSAQAVDVLQKNGMDLVKDSDIYDV